MDTEIFLLALKQRDGTRGLAPFKTDHGQFHFGFSSRSVAEQYLEVLDFGEQVYILKLSDLTSCMRYDVSRGILLFRSEASIRAFALGRADFDHDSHVVHLPEVPASEYPW